MARALVVVSPAAGRGRSAPLRGRLRSTIETALSDRGLSADFPAAASAHEAARLLRGAAANGYELVVVAGGDGSVRLAVGALAGGPLPLGIVPLGTGNLLAATLGVARDPIAAARRLATAAPLTIDTGLFEAAGFTERFAVAAGIGFDARIMAATSAAAKARFGVLAYFATVVRLIGALPVSAARISVDGRVHELSAVAVLVANCGQIVPGLLGPRLLLDPTDGLLDVIAIQGGSWLTKVPVAARSALHSLLRGDAETAGHSLRLRGTRIEVRTSPPEPVEVDGDLLPVDDGAFVATAMPGSLTVLV
jgi:diacylglycerol kinase family enzyme